MMSSERQVETTKNLVRAKMFAVQSTLESEGRSNMIGDYLDGVAAYVRPDIIRILGTFN